MNSSFFNAVQTFLRSKRIAVAGYSNDNKQPANYIYEKFKNNGYSVYAVNPKNSSITHIPCYRSLSEISDKIDGVMICTPPDAGLDIIKECQQLGIQNVWLHQSFGNGSYNKLAVELCKAENINCVHSGCPMMFINPDIVHLCIRGILSLGGRFKKI